jgi:hypothetical protein
MNYTEKLDEFRKDPAKYAKVDSRLRNTEVYMLPNGVLSPFARLSKGVRPWSA